MAFGIRTFLKSIVASFAVAGLAQADPGDSPLKLAFQQARAERNIDHVLPVLLKSRLHVVVGGQTGTGDFFLVRSPNKERLCVTVSESVDNLNNIAWPKIEVTGAKLLEQLPPEIEIVVVYKDGGDYMTREHLQWYRSIVK